MWGTQNPQRLPKQKRADVEVEVSSPTRNGGGMGYPVRSRGIAELTGVASLVYLTSRLNTIMDALSKTFAALADPTRRAILARLASGEVSVTELAEPFDMSLPAVSKHLKVLERAGLVARGREAQWRPCRLEAGPLKSVAEWAGEYRRFWEASFDRLDEYLRDLRSKEKKRGRERKR
jgi:DNA-binding transcriptional ArsR family regulator